ncbi:MAG TPA: hypothetical protein VHN79_01840 [Lacunisphaera sp.]|nr:hypothetical protein [Lacunisphaera sp.]
MNLADARSAVALAMGRMNSIYSKPLFDEWVLVKLASEQGVVLAYEGPRPDTYQAHFKTEVAQLQAEMEQRHLTIGDFEFVQTAHGLHFDACIRLGTAAYLFCNNTTKSMIEIRQDPRWLDAQKPFLDLATKFRSDPLE